MECDCVMQLCTVNRPLILQHQATRSQNLPALQARPTHYVGQLRQHGCEAATFFFFQASHEERGLSRLPDRTRGSCGTDATKIGLCRTSRSLPTAELPSHFPLPPSFDRVQLLMFTCSSRLFQPESLCLDTPLPNRITGLERHNRLKRLGSMVPEQARFLCVLTSVSSGGTRSTNVCPHVTSASKPQRKTTSSQMIKTFLQR